MRKLLLSFLVVALALRGTGSVAAAFTDSANATGNVFRAGTLDLQLSQDGSTWVEDTNLVWQSPADWAPGESFSDTLWLRDAGTVDIETLQFTMSDRTRTGTDQLDEMVNLTGAWYDRDGDGVNDGGSENLLTAGTFASYDANANGTVTLEELYNGMVGGVGALNLEAGAEVLPGSVTSPTLGGPTGAGKRLQLTWTFDSSAGNTYQGTQVTVDFDFTGSNL